MESEEGVIDYIYREYREHTAAFTRDKTFCEVSNVRESHL